MAISLSQRWALVIIKMITSLISLMASSILLYHIILQYRHSHHPPPPPAAAATAAAAAIEDPNRRPQQPSSRIGRRRIVITPFHRLVFGLSLMDVLYSFWSALGTIPVPPSTGVVFGFGTTASCTAQGFFTQLMISTPMYLASLSIYFMLKVRYNVSDDYVARYIEFWLHAIPWTVAILLGSLGIYLQLYNPISILEMGCWLSSIPSFCIWLLDVPCERGYNVDELSFFYVILFSIGWIFASFVVVLVCNMLIYFAIRKQERRNQMYLASHLQRTQRSRFARTRSLTTTTSLGSYPNPIFTQSNHPPISPLPDNDTETPHEYNENDHTYDQSQTNGNETPIVSSSLVFSIDENHSDNRDNHIDSTNNEENNSSMHHDQPLSSGMIQSRRRIIFDSKMKASRTALKQSILYVTTSFSTVLWITVPFIVLELGSTNERLGFFLVLMVNGVVPLQGLFTLIIFVRLDYVRRRQTATSDGCKKRRFQCVRECLFSPDIH